MDPASEALKKHGLKIVGSLAVADEEAEIKTKLTEARRLSKQLSYSLMQQQGTMSPQELQKTVKNARQPDQPAQVRDECRQPADDQVPGATVDTAVDTAARASSNNDAAEMYAELAAYRQSAPDGDQSRFAIFSTSSRASRPTPRRRRRSTPRSGSGATPIIRHLLTSASSLTRPPQNTTSSPRTTRSRKHSPCSAKG